MAIASIPESFSLIKVLGLFEHKVNAVGLKNLGSQVLGIDLIVKIPFRNKDLRGKV